VTRCPTCQSRATKLLNISTGVTTCQVCGQRWHTVHVTQEDIAQGRPSEADHCPVARALTRALGEPISVGDRWYRLRATWSDGLLPRPARTFVKRFDASQPVAPFTFTVSADHG